MSKFIKGQDRSQGTLFRNDSIEAAVGIDGRGRKAPSCHLIA